MRQCDSLLHPYSWGVSSGTTPPLLTHAKKKKCNVEPVIYSIFAFVFTASFSSGTPVQNNLGELLALLSFLMPTIFRSDVIEMLLEFLGEVERKADSFASVQVRNMKPEEVSVISWRFIVDVAVCSPLHVMVRLAAAVRLYVILFLVSNFLSAACDQPPDRVDSRVSRR